MSFSGGSDSKKKSACNVGAWGSIPSSGRSPREGNGNLLQYSAWEIPWTGEPGGLQTMGLHRVRHDLVTEHTHRCQYRLTDCTKQMYPLCRNDDDLGKL